MKERETDREKEGERGEERENKSTSDPVEREKLAFLEIARGAALYI